MTHVFFSHNRRMQYQKVIIYDSYLNIFIIYDMSLHFVHKLWLCPIMIHKLWLAYLPTMTAVEHNILVTQGVSTHIMGTACIYWHIQLAGNHFTASGHFPIHHPLWVMPHTQLRTRHGLGRDRQTCRVITATFRAACGASLAFHAHASPWASSVRAAQHMCPHN